MILVDYSVHRSLIHRGRVFILHKGDRKVLKMTDTNGKLTAQDIEYFQKESNLQLTSNYKDFLLTWNGGYIEPHLFKISDEQGISGMNLFYGIGDIDDNLLDVMDDLDGRLPSGFIAIGDDPNGNQICLGTSHPHHDHIYFWDHENEPDLDEPDRSNMYFLADNIWAFLDNLYDDE